MSETLQIVNAILGFLSASLVAILAFFTFRLNHKSNTTAAKVDNVVVAAERQGAQLTGVVEKVVKIEKQTDGLATMIGEAKLAQGLAQGGMQERNRADDKAEALADSKPLEGKVTAIIAEYKAGELKADVAELKVDLAANPKNTVDEIEKREGK